MSRTEDYLDELLHSVSSPEEEKTGESRTGKRQRTPEDDFLSAFEEEILSGEDSADFLQQFEQELDLGGKGFDDSAAASENMESLQSGPMESSAEAEEEEKSQNRQKNAEEEETGEDAEKAGDMEDLDSILHNAKERMGESPESSEAEDDFDGGLDLMVDTFEDGSEEDAGEDTFQEKSDLGKRLDNIADATEQLTGLGDLDKDFALDDAEFDTETFGIGDDVSELAFDADTDEEENADAADGKKKRVKKERRKKKEKENKKDKDGMKEDGEKMSFWKKLALIVFGEDEEKLAESASETETTGAEDEVSGADLDLLKELEGGGAKPETEPQETDKKDKKEKKKKEKKPKEKKPKKEKPPKEKKPKKEKPPKEKDMTPPLPKAPVILIFIMSASLLALILVGTNLVGYTNQFAEADAAYKLGDYEEAYRAVRGVKVKESDTAVFEKYQIMANVQSGFDAYQSFMEAGIYDMALDSLLQAIGRCNKYAADAEVYECYSELIALKDQAVGALSTFGLNEERAAELYAIEDKTAYTIELHNILINAGLVTEE